MGKNGIIVILFMTFTAIPCRADTSFKEDGRDIGQGLKKIGKETGRAFKEGGKEVGQGFKKLGKEAGPALKQGSKESGQAAQKAKRSIGEWFRNMGHSIKRFFSGSPYTTK